MSKKSPNPPAQPDYNKLIKTQANVNRINSYDPFGSIEYSGPNKTIATTTLSPEQQAFLNQRNDIGAMAGELAQSYAGQLPTDPFSFDFNRGNVEDAVYQRGLRLLEPQFEQQQRTLDQKLANQGLPMGSEAYNTEQTRFQDAQNRALEDLAFRAVEYGGTEESRALANQLTARQAPMAEIGGLLGLQPFQMPGQVGGQPVDAMGPAQLAQNADLARYQGKLQSSQGMMSGLYGLGSAAIMAMAMMSDIRVKTDIRKVGRLDNGLPVYAYRFKSGGPIQIGVMAQDVERVDPGAVIEIDGIKHVDYGKAVNHGR